MPPPQCPECGRFLATAFVEQIKVEAQPCPGCGTELSLGDDEAATPEDAPPVPPPAATLPADVEEPEPAEPEGAASDGDDDDVPAVAADEDSPAATEAPDGEEVEPSAPVVPPPAATLPEADGVEPEHDTSVRPPDRDPLEGWDESGTLPVVDDDTDPVVLAAGAGAGLLVGVLLGGREHRGLGALLGAVLGALVALLATRDH